MRNVDGTNNKSGDIRYKIQISYNIENNRFKDWFYVTRLGDQRLILGLPWLREINPRIDWSEGTVRFPDERKIDPEKETTFDYDEETECTFGISKKKKN